MIRTGFKQSVEMNREYRKSLIEKYLNAETDVAQEQMLAEWFYAHGAEADEEAVARLVIAEYQEACYEADEKEFDSIMVSRKRGSAVIRRACGFAACIVVAAGMGLFFTHRNTPDFNGMEIAQGIERIMALDMENVKSVIATPVGNNVILTAIMNDGSKCSYIMSKTAGTEALSITAMANN